MPLIYTKEIYNDAVANKIENESIIADIYANYKNYTFQQQMDMLEIVDSLKAINEEYQKYIIIYNQQTQTSNTDSEYVVIQGDTLQRIAQKMTGNHSNWSLIYNHNNLKDIMLNPGDTLLIPLV